MVPIRREVAVLARTPGGRVLVGSVGAIAALTLIGLLALWPYGYSPGAPAARSGITSGTVREVISYDCGGIACVRLVVAADGADRNVNLGAARLQPTLHVGDHVRLLRSSGGPYTFRDLDRRTPLLVLALVLVVLAAVVLRVRGLLAVLGVCLSLAIVLSFLVPAILDGKPALLVALVASLAVMFVTLVLTNGIGAQTFAGVLGVTATLVLTCGLAWLATGLTRLDGRGEGELLTIAAQAGGSVSLRGIVLASMLIGALGVLADTAVTQASAVMALRRANPDLAARGLYREAVTVGRDHLSATIHTLVLAYAGAVLPLLLLLRGSQVASVDVLSLQSISTPIVATAVGVIALIAAVPLTTGLAALLVARVPPAAIGEGHGHHH
jgi:uncharacterized membrane protein